MDAMDAPIWRYKDYVERTGHPSVLVRRWAVERLVDLYDHRAKKAVCELAHDDDVYVATTAIDFIARHSLANWAFPLLAKFRESEGVIAGSCAVALARLGFDEAIPFFAEKFDNIGNLEVDELVGILRALELIPTLEASRLVLRIAHLFEESTNGVFAAILVRSMLIRNKRDLLEWAVNYFLRRSFSLDDKGARVLETLMQGAGVVEHVQRVQATGLSPISNAPSDRVCRRTRSLGLPRRLATRSGGGDRPRSSAIWPRGRASSSSRRTSSRAASSTTSTRCRTRSAAARCSTSTCSERSRATAG